MSTYTIGEVAERSGFSASALRYYEGIGLVAPATRTDAGYRVYDEQSLARLDFVARAKELGCTLEEITDLLAIRDADECAPVQRRFHELVTGKIRTAQRRVAELAGFTAQLQAAAARLAAPPVDGPCDEQCACTGTEARAPSPPVSTAVELGHEPGGEVIACGLDPGAMAGRVADWQAVLGRARTRTTTPDGGLRVGLDDDVDLGHVARLAAAEQGCCSFFSFTLTVDGRGRALEVRAPDGAADIVASLFGVPS